MALLIGNHFDLDVDFDVDIEIEFGSDFVGRMLHGRVLSGLPPPCRAAAMSGVTVGADAAWHHSFTTA